MKYLNIPITKASGHTSATISKKIGACVLSALMAMALAPTPQYAFAAEGQSDAASSEQASGAATDTTQTTPATNTDSTMCFEVNGTQFASLQEAIAGSSDGDTIKVIADVDMTGAKEVALDNRNLDLNGHTISADQTSFVIIGNNITIQNGTMACNDTTYGLSIGGSKKASDNILLENLTVIGGVDVFNATGVVFENVEVDNSVVDSPFYAIWFDYNTEVTIKSGTYISNGKGLFGSQPVISNYSGNVTIEGGEFENAGVPFASSGNTYKPVIEGGTYSNGDQAAPYLADGYALAYGSGEEATVVKITDVVPTAPKGIDDNLELITTELTPGQKADVENALADETVQEALAKASGTENLMIENVELRDRVTHVEQHPDSFTFELPYPADIDAAQWQNYTFAVVHLRMEGTGVDSTCQPEVLDESAVVPTETGLQITSSLSPFLISYQLEEENPTADNDTDQATDDAASATDSTDTSNGAKAHTTVVKTVPQTGDEVPVAVFALLALLGLAVAGASLKKVRG